MGSTKALQEGESEERQVVVEIKEKEEGDGLAEKVWKERRDKG